MGKRMDGCGGQTERMVDRWMILENGQEQRERTEKIGEGTEGQTDRSAVGWASFRGGRTKGWGSRRTEKLGRQTDKEMEKMSRNLEDRGTDLRRDQRMDGRVEEL